MAKFDIKTVKPKFVVTTSPENKIDVVVNKPIITSKNAKSFFQLKNTGGPKGEKGDQGDAATISVASTSTGAAGTDASVVNQGTAHDAQLAFTIPRGDKGDKGDTGARGFSPKAWVTRGDDYAQINIENEYSTSQARVYDGTDGQDGQAATISVASTSTLPAGSPATVENVGTSSAASLAFGIPQGVAGQDGADGADGFSPVATVTPTGTGATISITDAEGTTTADITNGVNGQDGDAATITVGTVTTLQPNQSAYVTNVGTTSQAIFDIGIPKGDKGDAGSGSGDMLASDYDPSNTVKAAGGIPDYVSAQLPGDMTGATSSTAGAHGLVPAPAAGDQGKYLKGDGTWANTPAPELVEMSYGESNAWAKFIAAYNANCIVYCRASSNANPASGSQTRKAFMAYVNNETTPTQVEFQYYRSVSSHSDSQQGDQVFVYTLKNDNTWSVTTRNTFSKVVAGTNMTSSYSSGTLTLNATQPTVPTKTSDLTNDGSDGTSTYVEADELATVATTGAYSDLSGTPSLATVATSGDYDDLTNKPTIPQNKVVYVNSSLATPTNITGVYNDSGLTSPADTSTMGSTIKAGGSVMVRYGSDEVAELTAFDDHTSGSPSIISFTGQFLGNWKTNEPLFIKLIYSNTGSSWSAEGVDLPTNTSDLTNDGSDGTSTYVEADELATVATSGSYSDLSGTPTIPTQLSDLGGTIGTSQIADSAVTPAKLARGSATLVYYDTSAVTVTDATYSALKSGTITTHGGDIFVNGFVYGTKSGGGVTYLYAKIDNTEYKLSQTNINGNMTLYGSQVISGISAGTHTVSFAVTTQSGSGRSYTVSGYCQDWMTFIEI